MNDINIDKPAATDAFETVENHLFRTNQTARVTWLQLRLFVINASISLYVSVVRH